MAFSNRLKKFVAYAMPDKAGLEHLYSPARESEELLSESEISNNSTSEKHERPIRRTHNGSNIITCLAFFFFASTTALLVLELALRTPSDKECIKKMLTYCETTPFQHKCKGD